MTTEFMYSALFATMYLWGFIGALLLLAFFLKLLLTWVKNIML